MSYILSAQRDSPEYSEENSKRYLQHLASLRDRFPKNAYEIATSEWWYSFDDPGVEAFKRW